MAAGDEDHEGGLGTGQKLLDNDLVATFAEAIFLQHGADGLFGGGKILTNEDPLAGGEAAGFNDDGEGLAAEVIDCGGDGIEAFPCGGGDVMPLKEGLAERLTAFEAGGVPAGAEDGKSGGAEMVGDAGGEGGFGADNDQTGVDFAGEGEDGGGVAGIDGAGFGFGCDTAIARGDDGALDGGTAQTSFEEGVFPAAGAEDKDSGGKIHGPD